MIPLRDENPTVHPPRLTVALIVINVLIFLWQQAGDPVEAHIKVFRFASVPFNLTQTDSEAVMVIDGRMGLLEYVEADAPVASSGATVVTQAIPAWQTLLTCMFLHGGWMHLLGNMLFLWIFGNNIEDAMGSTRFGVYYLLCGLMASAAHIAFHLESMIPTIGASGAISGVLGGYLVLYPKARILTVLPLGILLYTLHLPALVFLPLWFFIQIKGVLGGGDGGVAWMAHAGGFVVGLVLVKLLESREHRDRGRIQRAPTPFVHRGSWR